MLECNYFPLPRFNKLKNENLSKSLYKILQNKFNITNLNFRDMIISVALANLKEAKLLEKSVGFPLLLLKVSMEDENCEIVYVGSQYIISDRYELRV